MAGVARSRSPQLYRYKSDGKKLLQKPWGKVGEDWDYEVWSDMWSTRLCHPFARRAHPTHNMAQIHDVLFCVSCVEFARNAKNKKLLKPCPGHETMSGYQFWKLRRLQRGEFPNHKGHFNSFDKRTICLGGVEMHNMVYGL